RVDWIAVEECRCNGFFALASVFEGRLPKLNAAERRDLSLRIRKFRGMGLEAWCTTTDGTVDGPLLVRTERPDRAKQSRGLRPARSPSRLSAGRATSSSPSSSVIPVARSEPSPLAAITHQG